MTADFYPGDVVRVIANATNPTEDLTGCEGVLLDAATWPEQITTPALPLLLVLPDDLDFGARGVAPDELELVSGGQARSLAERLAEAEALAGKWRSEAAQKNEGGGPEAWGIAGAFEGCANQLAQALATAQAPAPREPHNRWLPGEQGNSGVYADDNCEGGYLRVMQDEQGDVYFSLGRHPRMGLLEPSVRMVSHCTRRPHVIQAARALADALKQEAKATAQGEQGGA